METSLPPYCIFCVSAGNLSSINTSSQQLECFSYWSNTHSAQTSTTDLHLTQKNTHRSHHVCLASVPPTCTAQTLANLTSPLSLKLPSTLLPWSISPSSQNLPLLYLRFSKYGSWTSSTSTILELDKMVNLHVFFRFMQSVPLAIV